MGSADYQSVVSVVGYLALGFAVIVAWVLFCVLVLGLHGILVTASSVVLPIMAMHGVRRLLDRLWKRRAATESADGPRERRR